MLKITEIYAYISTDETGEGILAHQIGDTFMPLIGADLARVKALRPYAENVRRATGVGYRLVRFTTMTDVTEILGGGE